MIIMPAKTLPRLMCSGILVTVIILALSLLISPGLSAAAGPSSLTGTAPAWAPVPVVTEQTRSLVSLINTGQPAAAGVLPPLTPAMRVPAPVISNQVNPNTQQYTVIGWNNLGMHCYSPDFSNLAILPVYNTLEAQVIRRGDPPQIVTTGVNIQYRFPENTWSAGRLGRPNKTNFWQYAKDLYGVSLAPNVGLAGKGLAGSMDPVPAKSYFIAEGIPLTDIRDQDAVNRKSYPFQKAQLTLTDQNKTFQDSLTVVAPVSTELSCYMCHADGMDATTRYAPDVQPTGKVETNILTIHDFLNRDTYANYLAGRPDLLAQTPLMENQPVNCAACHADNAVGSAGVAGVRSLSNAMHGHHNPANAPDITPDTAGCYSCHPGPQTQCLRDTMSQNLSLQCTDCHGDITKVAQNPDPWLNEPKCGNPGCHGEAYNTSQPLFQNSIGHGGLYCEACHDSTHATAISREPNDAIKFRQIQGHAGTLSNCTVCHATKPTAMFNHTPRG